MTTDRFSKQDFETALAKAVNHANALSWGERGFVLGEYRYNVSVNVIHDKPITKVIIEVASSVGQSGYADEAGENSIRLWLTDQDGQPLGSKIQRWITRVPGWQDRLADQLDLLTEMGKSIRYCPKCRSSEKIFKVKKDGPNKGRLFIKCECKGSFEWLDVDDDGELEERPQPVQPEAPVAKINPPCPLCGTTMVQRQSKSGPFYACPRYPACNGSTDYFEYDPGKALERYPEWNKAINSYRWAGKTLWEPITGQTVEEIVKIDYAEAEHKVAALQGEIVDKPSGFVPSVYQQAIFDAVKSFTKAAVRGHLVVNAVAGSGKTTTIVQALELIPSYFKVVFVAFNRHIAAELKRRAPNNVRVTTYNGLGWGIVLKAFPGCDLDEFKLDRILLTILDKETHKHLYSPVKQIVGLLKANLMEATLDNMNHLCDHHGIELNGDADVVFAAAGLLLERSMDVTDVADYDDQCYWPIAMDLPMPKYDFVFVDEAQDTNKCQIELALRSVSETGHIVAVGDPYQSLYGFRGADVDAIPNIVDALNAKTLPLSVTYRNPKSVVELVNQKFEEIPLEAAEWAIDGKIETIHIEKAVTEMVSGDMILCRTNAPLVRPAFTLIRQGIKATIRGRDIGKGLLVLIKKMQGVDMPDLMLKLADYKEREMAKLIAADKGSQAQSVEDKVDTVIALADGLNEIQALETRIESVFSDDDEGVIFSSVHRSKGLEAKRVYLLRPDLMPHPMAKKDWEQVQERNIEYVAYTRSLEQLIFVAGEL